MYSHQGIVLTSNQRFFATAGKLAKINKDATSAFDLIFLNIIVLSIKVN